MSSPVEEVRLDQDELLALDARVRRAQATGRPDGLHVLGWGEISSVLGWPLGAPRAACKLLPPMTAEELESYREVFARYLATLEEHSVRPVPSLLQTASRPDGTAATYCVQPLLPAGSLAPDRLRADIPAPEHPLLAEVVESVTATISDRVGLDAQLSNWCLVDDTLWYLDVTTPMLRGPDGAELLDLEPILRSMPAVLRPAVRRFVAPDILGRYYDPRSALRDIAANLHKERLTAWLPAVLAAANARVSPALTAGEVVSDYREDARTWRAVQSVRRLDRHWHLKVRGRPYPFLLPGRIER